MTNLGVNRYWGAQKPNPLGVTAVATGKTAMLRIYDPIDDWGQPYGVSAKEFAKVLDELDRDVETIELHVHSPGGLAWEGVAIMNLLRQHPAKVHAVVDGMAASAASYIVVGGADHVSMAPNATLMIHDASGICVGQAADMKLMLDRLEGISQNVASIYAEKAGGTADEWRAAMQPETWFTADEAVEAGLADEKLKPGSSTAAPTDRFDLSIFAHAGREHAPEPLIPAARAAHTRPADPPVHNDTKEDGAMPDIPIRDWLELDESVDDDAVKAAFDEMKAKAERSPEPAEMTDEQALAVLAKSAGIDDVDKVKAALDGAKAGKVTVSQAYLDTIEADAKAGRDARERQLADDRDSAIKAAQRDGKLARDKETFDRWKTAWDADPEGTKADLDKLGVRFPVGETEGYAGHDGSAGEGAVFNDDEAEEFATVLGVTKEALTNG